MEKEWLFSLYRQRIGGDDVRERLEKMEFENIDEEILEIEELSEIRKYLFYYHPDFVEKYRIPYEHFCIICKKFPEYPVDPDVKHTDSHLVILFPNFSMRNRELWHYYS